MDGLMRKFAEKLKNIFRWIPKKSSLKWDEK